MQGQRYREYESLSLKLLAVMMYQGDFGALSCQGCQMKEQLNCDMDENIEDQVYYFDPLSISINTCPLNCIQSQHIDFFDRYKYYSESGKMPEYEQCQAWYWRLHKEFSGYRARLEAISGTR